MRQSSSRRVLFVLMIVLATSNVRVASGQQGMVADNPTYLVRVGDRVIKVNEDISIVQGFGNTFMVTTSEGDVIIDTSIAMHARKHHQLLTAENKAPIKYIILTHAHGDHTGGIPLWKEAGTQIIAQKNHVEFVNYQARLNGFFALRNAAQFALPRPAPATWPGDYGAKIEPTILFDDKYE